MGNYYIAKDRFGNYDLQHGVMWRHHKYIRKEGNRYIYPDDAKKPSTDEEVARERKRRINQERANRKAKDIQENPQNYNRYDPSFGWPHKEYGDTPLERYNNTPKPLRAIRTLANNAFYSAGPGRYGNGVYKKAVTAGKRAVDAYAKKYPVKAAIKRGIVRVKALLKKIFG